MVSLALPGAGVPANSSLGLGASSNTREPCGLGPVGMKTTEGGYPLYPPSQFTVSRLMGGTAMLPVATDAEAFARVRQRLQNDVGRLIQASNSIMQQHWTVPFWGIVRMLFPVAE